MNDIPDWAGKRACELLNAESLMRNWCWPRDLDNRALITVAKLVMQHETKPVDPDEEAVKRIICVYAGVNAVDDSYFFSPPHLARAVSQYKQEKGNG